MIFNTALSNLIMSSSTKFMLFVEMSLVQNLQEFKYIAILFEEKKKLLSHCLFLHLSKNLKHGSKIFIKIGLNSVKICQILY